MSGTNKNDKRSQKGRSMVEILGVLAIIGVLSVGGISAYSAAMAKVKANGLMEATLKEAFLISDQLMMGVVTPKLSGFSKSLFDSVSVVPNTNNFELTLKAVDEDVCENLKSLLGALSMVQNITDDCLKVTFNKNLTAKKTTQSGGEGGESGGDSGGGNNESIESSYCSDGRTICGESCCDLGKFCFISDGSFECVAHSQNGCSQNSDCDLNQYCAIIAKNYDNMGAGHIPPQSGECRSLPNLNPFTYNNQTFYLSPRNEFFTFWSGENICLAHGKKMANIASLGLNEEYRCQEECAVINEFCVFEDGNVIQTSAEACLEAGGFLNPKACGSDSGELFFLKSCDDCILEDGTKGMCGGFVCLDIGEFVDSCNNCEECLSISEYFLSSDCEEYKKDKCSLQHKIFGIYYLSDLSNDGSAKVLEAFDEAGTGYEGFLELPMEGSNDYVGVICKD